MVFGKPMERLDEAFDHYDGGQVLAILNHHRTDAATKVRAHEWMQGHFDSIAPTHQSMYIDRIIESIRWGRVQNPSTTQHLLAWLSRPRAYQMTATQVTNYNIMLNFRNKVSWCNYIVRFLTCGSFFR